MGLIRINHNPSPSQLRLFGGVWLVVFAAISFLMWLRGGSRVVAFALVVGALCVPLAGWAWPLFMRWVYLGMSYLAFPIGWAISHIVLALIYYGVLTPIGLLMRLFGYDPMHRRFDTEAPSYWSACESRSSEDYFHQF